MMSLVKEDCRSTTGKNLRYILLKTRSASTSNLDWNTLEYHSTPAHEVWKINFAKDLIEQQSFSNDENLKEILEYMLTT